MKEQVTDRLKALKQELDAGQKMLADLDARRVDLQQTLLRISGAIQVLEELLAPTDPAGAANGATAADAGAPPGTLVQAGT